MTWYEDPAQFLVSRGLPPGFEDRAGPNGVALVSVFAEGRTTPGWGLAPTKDSSGFIENYRKHRFRPEPRVRRFEKAGKPFAIVMRSVSMLAVDIDRHVEDGGADGFLAAAKLGLPPTLAQTSRSGAGRHLFYLVPDSWSQREGYGAYPDALGLEPGIDVRAVGCIYRYETQRWNNLPLADAPQELLDRLTQRKERQEAKQQMMASAAAASPDSEEALIMHFTLEQELQQPIPVGKRNNTLFAIGSQMKEAGYPEWEKAIEERASDIGIGPDETAKLIANIQRYA